MDEIADVNSPEYGSVSMLTARKRPDTMSPQMTTLIRQGIGVAG